MEVLDKMFVNPIAASLFAWLAWNAIMFRIEKDGYDKDKINFPLIEYVKRTYDNWIASLFMIPVLLFIGYNKLEIQMDGENLQWSDLYYLASGFATELVIVAWNKWKNKKAA